MKKLVTLLLAMSMLLTMVVGCGKTNSDNNTVAGNSTQSGQTSDSSGSGEKDSAPVRDEVTVRNSNRIDNYNPIEWYTTVQSPLFSSVYSTLIRIVYADDGTASYVGDLAESWELENDGAVWVFHLNPNAKFTNGEPVTAEDVKFSFEITAQNAYSSWKVIQVQSIETRDEHTVAIDVGSYNNCLPWDWAEVPIVEADAYQADLDAYMAEQIGSGPYKLESLEEETGNFVLVRNDDYYGEPANIKTVNVRVITESSSAVIALQSGEIDYMYLSGVEYELVKDDPNLETKSQPSGYGGWLMLNTNKEPLNNKLLRQAIGYAINYEALYALRCGGYTAEFNPTTPYCAPSDPPSDIVNTYSYNPEKAKELIAQSGLSTPIDLGELYGGTGGTAELIQQNLAEVGITCQPVSLEQYAMVDAYLKGNYTIGVMGGIGGGTMTAAATLKNNYSTGGYNNIHHYSNAEVDVLIAELNITKDEARYDELREQILEIIVDDAPIFNLGTGAYFSAYVNGLKVPACNTGMVFFADLAW